MGQRAQAVQPLDRFEFKMTDTDNTMRVRSFSRV
jgi:hypothetical protein